MSHPPPLSVAEVLADGWSEKFARVLMIEQAGVLAVAVVDGNGDGAELEFEEWEFCDGEWCCLSSMGFGPLDQPVGDAGSIGEGGIRLVGNAPPGTRVTCSWLDDRREVVANEHGLWAFVSDRATDDPAAKPTVEGVPSRWNAGRVWPPTGMHVDPVLRQVGDRP